MRLSHLKPSWVDIAPDLAVFLSESSPWPCLAYLPHITELKKCVYISTAFGGSFHLGYLYYSLKKRKRQEEALGFQVCQVGMVQGSREITV